MNNNGNQNQNGQSVWKTKKARYLSILGAAIIIVIGVALVISQDKSAKTQDIAVSPEVAAADLSAPATAPATPSRADALKQYAKALVQVGDTCAVTPKDATFVKGTRVMVDNAGTTTQTVSLGDMSVVLKPLHYKTLKLDTTGTLAVLCNDKATDATVKVQ